MNEAIHLEIPTKTIIKVILFVSLAIIIYLIRDIFIILFFAIVLASTIKGPVDFLENYKIPRVIGTLIVYLVIFGILAFIIYQIIPSAIIDLQLLNQEFPDVIEKFFANLKTLETQSIKYFDIINRFQNYILSIANLLKQAASSFIQTTSYLLGGAASALSIVIISFYLSVQKNGIENFIKAIFPKKWENYILNLWLRSQNKMSNWLRGQIILCLAVGILTFIGLKILGIKFAFLLALIAGILEIIPYIGPIMSAVPAVMLALFQNPILGLWVIVLYIIVQQLENHFLVPVIMAKAIGLNPILIIVSLLIGAKLFGILGLIIAVPMAGVIVEAINDYLKRENDKIEMDLGTV